MKVLVTGGAGFIGSHLVEELVKRGNTVHVVDNLSTGKIDNLRNVKREIVFHRSDIRNNLPAVDFDVVYHLAAEHSVPKSFENPQEYFDVNVGGSWDVFAQYQDSRIVNVSSSSAKYNKSPYAISKRTSEICAKLFPNIVSLRYFNVFGERQPFNGAVIPSFCNRMLRGERPIIFGDGEQVRDFTYVKDVVEETIDFGEGKRKEAKGVFSIGYGKTHSVNELFQKIAKILDFDKPPIFKEERIGDIRFSQSKEIMLNPKFGFEEGLRRTIDWYSENV